MELPSNKMPSSFVSLGYVEKVSKYFTCNKVVLRFTVRHVFIMAYWLLALSTTVTAQCD